MNKDPNWISWSLQFIAGFIVGPFIGCVFIAGGRRSIPVIDREYALVFLLGAAFIGGAMASYYGDSLWIGDSYRCIPPDRPQRNSASITASVTIGCIGIILVLIALALSLGFRI